MICGRVTVRKEGMYGYISCNGDDPFTERDEGAEPNEPVIFFIDGRKTQTSKLSMWKPFLLGKS